MKKRIDLTPEEMLQVDCNDYLRKRKIKFFHKEKAANSKARHPQHKGVPDLIIWPGNGKTLFIELKGPSGRLSPDQERFEDWAEDSGYRFFVVNSWDKFMLIMEGL